MNAQLAMNRQWLFMRLSAYDQALREDLVRKLPYRHRRWNASGRCWQIAICEADTVQRILAEHNVRCVWQR